MNVNLTPQDEAMIRQRLRASLALADEQIERGEGIIWGPEVMERLKREATANALQGKPIKDDVKP